MTGNPRPDAVAKEAASDVAHGSVPTLSAPEAYLAGWAVLAAINAILLHWPGPFFASPLQAVVLHAYDAAYLLLPGLASYAAISAWRRWGPRAPVWGVIAFAIFAALVSNAVFAGELDGLIKRRLPHRGQIPWTVVIPCAIGLAVVLIERVASLCARPYLRWVFVVAGIAASLAHQRQLRFTYEGLHFMVAWASALAIGASGVGASVPRRAARVLGRLRSPRLLGGTAAACMLAWLIHPGPAVWRQLFIQPGSVFPPIVARHVPFPVTRGAPPAGSPGASWLAPRTGDTPTPPGPALVPRESLLVLVLSVDALRADILADSAHEKRLPNLFELRREATSFSHMWSAAPSTRQTMMSLQVGRYARHLKRGGKAHGGYRDSPNLLEQLEKHDVSTIVIKEHSGVTRIARGAGKYVRRKREVPRARGTADAIIRQLERLRDRFEPTLLFVHFMDPHAPYHAEGDTRFDRYVGEVAHVDREIGRIRSSLRRYGMQDRTVIIVTADHGEAFLEHGVNFHTRTMYDEVVRVPLIVAAKGIEAREVAEHVSSIDIPSTVFDLFGVPTPPNFMGASLVPSLRGEDAHYDRPVAVQGTSHMYALIFPNGLKVIHDDDRWTEEVYDVHADPGERNNLAGEDSSIPYLQTARAFVTAHRPAKKSKKKDEKDARASAK